MLKFMGILALAVCPVLLGLGAAIKLKTRVKSLRLLIRLIDFISSHIAYESMPLQDIILFAEQSGSFSELDFIQAKNFASDRPFSEQLLDNFEKSQKKLCFCDIDFSIFAAFADGLGSTDSQGQIQHCALYKQSFEEELKSAQQKETASGKLYASLGVFAGLFILIMLF